MYTDIKVRVTCCLRIVTAQISLRIQIVSNFWSVCHVLSVSRAIKNEVIAQHERVAKMLKM